LRRDLDKFLERLVRGNLGIRAKYRELRAQRQAADPERFERSRRLAARSPAFRKRSAS
jgi:hypothetical protein